MNKEIEEYVKYLLNFGMVEKPIMPKFDVGAYTESEYLSVVFEWQKLFNFDDENLTIKHLKGEWWI